MGEEAASIWSWVRDANVGWTSVAVGIPVIALIALLLWWRPISTSDFVADRLPLFSVIAALLLLVAAAIVTLNNRFQEQYEYSAEDSVSITQIFTGLNAAYLFLALGVAIFVAALIALRIGSWTIADFGAAIPSLDRVRDMALIAAVLLFVGVALYSTANYLLQGTFSDEFTSIAPFTIAGSEDKQRGVALATAMRAKLAEIDRDGKVLIQLLQSESGDRQDDPDTPKGQKSPAKAALLELYESMNLELKFQGVDVGGLFNRVVDMIAMRRAMQITVAEGNDKAMVSGALRPDGTSHVHAIVDAKNDLIVAAVAYSKLRERFIAQQPAFEHLGWEDIKLFHETILDVTRLRARGYVKMSEFKPHLTAITSLVNRAPEARRLWTYGSDIAALAGNTGQALSFLDRAMGGLSDLRGRLDNARPKETAPDEETDAEENERNSEIFRELRQQFTLRYNSLLLSRQRALSACALPFVERLNDGEAPAQVLTEALAAHKKLLHITATTATYQPTIAIIGGVPHREVVHYPFKTAGVWIAGRPAYDNLADSLGSIIHALAPDAKLVFVPLGLGSRIQGTSNTRPSESEITKATQAALDAKADIILIPFPYLLKIRMEAIKLAAGKALVVSPAPSSRFQQRYKFSAAEISAALINSVDVDGRFKAGLLGVNELPISYSGALSAPGMRVPRLAPNGQWQASYSSGYAAANAAAVFANILAIGGRKTPDELLQMVRKTVQYPDQQDATIAVIDQAAALAGAPNTTRGVAAPNACGP